MAELLADLQVTEIFPEYISMDGEVARGFFSEVHTKDGTFYLDCNVEGFIKCDEVFEGRGMEPTYFEVTSLEIESGTFENEMCESRECQPFELDSLVEELKSRMEVEK